MRAASIIVCFSVATALTAGTTLAQGPIDLEDFSGSEQVITFAPGFASQCAPFEYEGVVFSENGGGTGGPCFRANSDWGSFFDNIPGASIGLGFNDQWGDSRIVMELPAGMRRVGCLLSTSPVTTWTMDLYDSSSTLIGSDTRAMPNTSEAVFIGYETAADIARVEIWETNGENGHITLMDDVRFEAVDGLRLAVTGDCPGTMEACASGAAQGDKIVIIYSFNFGSAGPVPGCPDLLTDLKAPKAADSGTADATGTFCTSGRVPGNACGRVKVQAINRTTCEKSSVVEV
ncbi:MAG: hypothetical protein D8M59_01165 [Planctomycetes bacterium]|nr:hypothetical protein [Planctomycetota bacterium]NOG54669.1 hypothetical protein [Planctomycetota bacterium]